jgi:hypothetical protein
MKWKSAIVLLTVASVTFLFVSGCVQQSYQAPVPPVLKITGKRMTITNVDEIVVNAPPSAGNSRDSLMNMLMTLAPWVAQGITNERNADLLEQSMKNTTGIAQQGIQVGR